MKHHYFVLILIAALAVLLIGCKKRSNHNVKQESIENKDTITGETNLSDTLIIPLGSIPDNQREEPDSLAGWEEIAPGLGLYYKRDLMLTMPIVDIVNPQLRMYLSDYIVPLVKRKGFDYKNNFIFVRYITDKQSLLEGESARIDILVDYCGITYRIARNIYEGKYQVAFIDGIPVMFEDFKAKGFIKDTSDIFEFRKWKNFIWLMTCDAETLFYFSVKDDKIYYIGYMDWELHLVLPDSKMPEVWKPEGESDIIPADTVIAVSDSLETAIPEEETEQS